MKLFLYALALVAWVGIARAETPGVGGIREMEATLDLIVGKDHLVIGDREFLLPRSAGIYRRGEAVSAGSLRKGMRVKVQFSDVGGTRTITTLSIAP